MSTSMESLDELVAQYRSHYEDMMLDWRPLVDAHENASRKSMNSPGEIHLRACAIALRDILDDWPE
jgi:hypothetical protein